MTSAAFSFLVWDLPTWSASWAWGLPLIVLTVVVHVMGLGLINRRVIGISSGNTVHRHPLTVFVVVMGATTLSATILHGMEVVIWAGVYRLLGALPNDQMAIIYSLNAMTSYGHEETFLKAHWQLMGAMEALNGWLLFGLTTAFLFAMIQRWSLNISRSRRQY